MGKKLKRLRGPLFLFLAALVWGTSFVAQDLASDSVQPFTFNGCRMLLGGLVLLPVVMIKNKGRLFASVPTKEDKKQLLIGGVLCGLVVFFAAYFQQLGIALGTSAGKSGFITAMYVIFVPLTGIFLKKRISPYLWGCVGLAAVGMYFLCMADFSAGFSGFLSGFAMEVGDLATLACALCFTLHILVIDRFAPHTDGVFLSCVQFLFAGVLGIFCMLILERPTPEAILQAGGAILYAALFSCGVGYTFQILGQSSTPPVIASILMCLESVFAVLSDVIFLKTAMTLEEVLGCVLMFFSILVSNLVDLIPKKEKKNESVR